jgi:hypothetical protein
VDDNERHGLSSDELDDIDKLSTSSDDDEPTEEECKTLRRIADQLPWSVWYWTPFPDTNFKAGQDTY